MLTEDLECLVRSSINRRGLWDGQYEHRTSSEGGGLGEGLVIDKGLLFLINHQFLTRIWPTLCLEKIPLVRCNVSDYSICPTFWR